MLSSWQGEGRIDTSYEYSFSPAFSSTYWAVILWLLKALTGHLQLPQGRGQKKTQYNGKNSSDICVLCYGCLTIYDALLSKKLQLEIQL